MSYVKMILPCLGLLTLIFACSSDNDPGVQQYSGDQLSDLSVSIIKNIETPYSGKIKPGGRVAQTPITLADISQQLADIFPDGTVLGAENEMERGLEVWSVKIKMVGGGILKIKFVKELGKIIKIKGKPGPFDYEVDPGGSFIKFSVAKALALNVATGEIKSWKLQIEEENQWEYEFHIVLGSKRYEVEVKGFGEEVVSIKEKKESDDEDNDGDDQGDDKEDDDNDNIQAPATVTSLATSLFEGTVTHSEQHKDDDRMLWKVYVKNAEDAVVKFYISENPVALEKMGGEVGPFTYNIVPGNDLISLNVALEKVFNEVDGDLMEWELGKEENQGTAVWIYEFEVKGAEVNYEFKINALTGEIIEFEQHG